MAAPTSDTPPVIKRRRGCFFYGCLTTLFLVLVFMVAGYLGFRYAVSRFTDSKPLPLPAVVELSPEETRQLRERITGFGTAVDHNQPTAPLTLTTDEANALIQSDPDWAFLKGQLYVSFVSNQFKAQISFPAEKLGSKRLRGRYLNASGTFRVSLHDGQLQVSADELSAKGEPVPENVMRHIRSHNFAASFTNAQVNAVLNRLQEVDIRDGKLVIVPKQTK
jgi:hypothetical protein